MAGSPAAALPFWDRETPEEVGSVRSWWRCGAEEGDGERGRVKCGSCSLRGVWSERTTRPTEADPMNLTDENRVLGVPTSTLSTF
jgi:hypothetical protein